MILMENVVKIGMVLVLVAEEEVVVVVKSCCENHTNNKLDAWSKLITSNQIKQVTKN